MQTGAEQRGEETKHSQQGDCGPRELFHSAAATGFHSGAAAVRNKRSHTLQAGVTEKTPTVCFKWENF